MQTLPTTALNPFSRQMSTSAFVAGTWIVAYKATQVVPCIAITAAPLSDMIDMVPTCVSSLLPEGGRRLQSGQRHV